MITMELPPRNNSQAGTMEAQQRSSYHANGSEGDMSSRNHHHAHVGSFSHASESRDRPAYRSVMDNGKVPYANGLHLHQGARYDEVDPLDTAHPRDHPLHPSPPSRFGGGLATASGSSYTPHHEYRHPSTANSAAYSEPAPRYQPVFEGARGSWAEQRDERRPSDRERDRDREDDRRYEHDRPSLSSHSSFNHPVRPAMPPPSSSATRSEIEDMKKFGMDYTTKGRKRKRLAKACSACHKNKRRCDGFAPCSNCEFSSRECIYVNSLGEAIPPPRTREASIVGLANHDAGHDTQDHMEVDELEQTPQRDIESKPIVFAKPPQSSRDFSQKPSDGSMRPQQFLPLPNGSSDGPPRPPAGESREYRPSTSLPDVDRISRDGADVGPSGGDRERSKPDLYQPQEEVAIRHEEREREKRWQSKVVELVSMDDTLVEELIHLFFVKLPPYSLMFHTPTFHHRRYQGEVVPALIHIMLALAVRFLDHPLLVPYAANRRKGAKPFPSYLKGHPFALRAKYDVDTWIRTHPDIKTLGRRCSAWERTEWAMTMCLIRVYEGCMGQGREGLHYQDLAIDMMRPSAISYQPYHPPPGTPRHVIVEAATMLAAQSRTLWLLYLHDCSSASNGRGRRLLDSEMRDIMLPGNEATWQRWGGIDATARGSSLAVMSDRSYGLGARSHPAEASKAASLLGEFAHVLRIISIYSDIVSLSSRPADASRRHDLMQHEQALKDWALALPPYLRFDETNLMASLQKLASPLPFVVVSGWCYSYMHAIAESGMVYLQAAAAASGQVPRDVTMQRQTQAVDNIGVILQSLGDLGRASPMTLVPLCIVTNWQQYATQAMPTSALSVASANIEGKLVHWWSEVSRLWGLPRSVVSSGELQDFQIVHMASGAGKASGVAAIPAPRGVRAGTTELQRPAHPDYAHVDDPRGLPQPSHHLTDLLNGNRDPKDQRDTREIRELRDQRDRRRSFVELPAPAGSTPGSVPGSTAGSRRGSPMGRLQAPPDGQRYQGPTSSYQLGTTADAQEERPGMSKRKSFVLDTSSNHEEDKQAKNPRAHTDASPEEQLAPSQRPHSVTPIVTAKRGRFTPSDTPPNDPQKGSDKDDHAMAVDGEVSPKSAPAGAERVSPGMAALLDAVEVREKSREKSE